MKGRHVAVVLAVLVAAVAAAVWFALRGGDAPDAPGRGPAPVVGTAEPARAPQAKPRARAGRKWVELGLGEVTGRVVEYGTEKPLAGVAVSLSAGLPGPDRAIETRTTADGAFRMTGVPNFAEWDLRVDAPAPLADVEQAGVSVVENKVTDLGVLYVTPGFAVPGIVVDEAGEPVEGAEVRVLRPRGPGAQFDLLRLIRDLPADEPAVDRATSARDGRFALKRTSPGNYDFKVVRPGRRILVERQVVVTPDTAKNDLRFVMVKGHALDGRVVRRGPGAVAGITVVAFRQPQGEFDMLVLDRTYCVTDEEGRFRLDGLGGGTYVVSAIPEGEPFAIADDVQVPARTFLEIALEGDAWLEGRVTGAGGAAVAGAQVYIASFRGGTPAVANARTDGEGRYAVRGLKSGRMEMFLVQAEGYAMWPADAASVFTGGAGSGVDLRPGRNEKDVSLEAGGIVRGVVVSKEDEKPLDGVRVQLVSVASILGGSRGATTDALGKFEITSAPLGTAVLSLSKEGWFQPGFSEMSVAMAFNPRAGKQADTGKGYVVTIGEAGQAVERSLQMARGSVVAGRVLAPDGTPVAGARVETRAEGDGGFLRQIGVLVGAATEPRLTDAEGRFEIAGPSPGQKVRVVATSRGWLEGRSEPMSAGIGQRVEGVDVRLRIGASVEGRVTDEAGRPVESASVRWIAKDDDVAAGMADWSLASATPTLTDADGRYRIDQVEPGPVVVEATHPRYLRVRRDDLTTEDGKAARFDAKLALGGTIDGKVLGPDGRPRSGATVVLERQDGPERDGWQGGPPPVSSDADGRFLAEGLEPGSYSVRATAKGCAPSARVAAATGAGSAVVLRLEPALRIAGTVRAAGAPVANVEVDVQRRVTGQRSGPLEPRPAGESGGVTESWEGVGSVRTSADGGFVVEDLAAGPYRLTFAAPSWGEGRANVLRRTMDDVAAGTESLFVDLEPGLVIRGTVVKEDGTPATNGWANAMQVSEGGRPVEDPVHAWCAVEDGRFEVIGLRAGTYEVSVNLQGSPGKRMRVEAGTTDVKVVLSAGGRITGRVVLADGSPATGVMVSVEGDAGGANGMVGADGRYTIVGVEPGRRTLRVWDARDDGGDDVTGSAEGVEVRAGETTEAPQIVARPEAPEPGPAAPPR